jgi:hypothetical protein
LIVDAHVHDGVLFTKRQNKHDNKNHKWKYFLEDLDGHDDDECTLLKKPDKVKHLVERLHQQYCL